MTAASALQYLGNSASQPTENKGEYLQVSVGGALQRIPEGSYVGCAKAFQYLEHQMVGGEQCICSEQQMQCIAVKFHLLEQRSAFCRASAQCILRNSALPVQGSVHWVGGGGGGRPTWGY